jgi:2-dehydro-3-deoxyphosphogluconate aldolase/(4S)-4-hydroxy-2-oxoglutarate aldolase
MPGVFSPTDISVALAHGCNTLKLFPADSVPLGYCKAMKGPFPDANFVAVGGVTPQNTADYLKAGYVGVGFGSSLAKKELFEQKNWTQIAADIAAFLNSLKEENLL